MESSTFSTPIGATRAEGDEVGLVEGHAPAPLPATLALTASLAAGALLFAIAVIFAIAHPEPSIARFLRLAIAEQNQRAKTTLYVLALFALFPAAVILVPRVADRVALRAPEALTPLALLVPTGLGIAVLVTRVSGSLPWGDGLWTLAAVLGAWWAATLILLARAARGQPSRGLQALSRKRGRLGIAALLAVAAGLATGTKASSLHVLPLVLGAVVVAVLLAVYTHPNAEPDGLRAARRRMAAGRLVGIPIGRCLEVLVAALLILAIVPAVVIQTSVGPPNLFVPPGIVVYHQDFLLGPANQLLRGGGALMAGVPISQYGVGPIYLLYGFFHVVPIGYGTYGLLDGLLTAGFYLCGYLVIRAAGVRRPLAISALAVAVIALLYDLTYPVGQLPQQGPLRFGLPMLVVAGLTTTTRWPRRAGIGRAVAFGALGLSAIWALETFAYTAATFAAMIGVQALLGARPRRGRWLARQAGLAVIACATTHIVLAGWTLAATGHLPDWGEYGTYIREFLAGHTSDYTYGFERWSPVLAVGIGTLTAAIVLVVVLRRARAFCARERTAIVAATGLTTMAITLLSYSDNRASTYLVAYVALPLLLVAVLWLHLLLTRSTAAPALRMGGLAVAATVAALLVAVAWPSVGSHFSRSLLAKARPGGGFRAAVHSLLHSPPADPRAPAGETLVNRYLPGRRVIVLTPLYADLATEILIRDGRANFFFTGDPKADSYVPSLWTGKVSHQIDQLRSGTRVLLDASALQFLSAIRSQPDRDVVASPIGLGDPEVEWVLQHLQRRFSFQPISAGPDGFVVERLVAR